MKVSTGRFQIDFQLVEVIEEFLSVFTPQREAF